MHDTQGWYQSNPDFHSNPDNASHTTEITVSPANHDVQATEQPDVTLVDNPNHHHVNPYYRHNADGSLTYVDGNPDPNVHDTKGWDQSNPDYRGTEED